jgi:hypothetical protein
MNALNRAAVVLREGRKEKKKAQPRYKFLYLWLLSSTFDTVDFLNSCYKAFLACTCNAAET